eukprot:TRINITY_DN15547_c0_g2_i1.p1 TRINITY_DN15547_c0_g2~~TRINITY_DN15547_c0_g2_i1.p1  ORF type:complete len:124 (-),score=25.94 TRINITY_DN15547_c0_g2_i1:126-497(-)
MAIASADVEIPFSNVRFGCEQFYQKTSENAPEMNWHGVLLGRVGSFKEDSDSESVEEKQVEGNDLVAKGFRSDASKRYMGQLPPDHPAWQAWMYHQEQLRLKGHVVLSRPQVPDQAVGVNTAD